MTRFSTIILEGGLGNRMRVAASAYAMARENDLPLRVLWTSQWGMRCRFDELFEEEPTVRERTRQGPDKDSREADGNRKARPCGMGEDGTLFLRDARGTERYLFARPTMKNLHLPRLLQRMLYRKMILAPEIWYLNKDGFDYVSWFRQGGALMTAYRDFYPWTTDDLRTVFHPRAEVTRLTDARCQDYSSHTIGVHIRRSDHQQAIDESPLELFTAAIDRKAEQYDDLRIYVATDDEPTKAALRERYGKRVLMSTAEATRENSNGIRDALVEMLALSRTEHIYGSAGSTFSPIAACLGDVPIDILQRDGKGRADVLVRASGQPGSPLQTIKHHQK